MDPTAAKYIGAGIACIGMGGAGVGVGIIFGNYLAAALRNPSAAQGQFGNLIFGFAITEALGIFSLLIALLLLLVISILSAQTDTPDAHMARAKAAAGDDFQNLFEFQCNGPGPGGPRGRTAPFFPPSAAAGFSPALPEGRSGIDSRGLGPLLF